MHNIQHAIRKNKYVHSRLNHIWKNLPLVLCFSYCWSHPFLTYIIFKTELLLYFMIWNELCSLGKNSFWILLILKCKTVSRTKLLLFLRVYPVAEDETSSGFCFVSALRVTVTPGLNWGLTCIWSWTSTITN